jgi:serine/threonine protein kinase
MSAEGEILLTDFGLSVILDNSLISKEKIRGTPGFMSPEMCGYSNNPISFPSDIFSIGLFAFDLIQLYSRAKYGGRIIAAPNNSEGQAKFWERTNDIRTYLENLASEKSRAQWRFAFEALLVECLNRTASKKIQTSGHVLKIWIISSKGTNFRLTSLLLQI